jgi:hypothetical protein
LLDARAALDVVHVVVPLVEGLIHQYYFRRKHVSVAFEQKGERGGTASNNQCCVSGGAFWAVKHAA